MLFATCAAAQIVEGTVVDSAAGSAIAGVTVQLFQDGYPWYTTTSDAHGHFLFDHVQNGVYTANYTSPDYEWDDMFRQPGGPQWITVTAGNLVKIEGHMMPMGHLMGRVLDAEGRPVAKAQVQVIGPGMQMILPTGADGRFDIHKFTFPGAYAVSAVPPEGFKPPAADAESGAARAWTRTYYPGVAEPEAAAKILLLPGGDVRDIELKLLAAAANPVRGVILNPEGKPAAKVEVALMGRAGALRATSAADGAFEFPAVVNGPWYLGAEADAGAVKLRAQQSIEMAGRPREGLKAQLHAPFKVSGKVVMDTPKGMTPPRGRPVDLTPASRPREFGFGRMDLLFRTPDDHGDFMLQPVYPDTYAISALSPPGYYLDAIRVGGAELASPEVEIASGPVSIEVMFKSNGGSVRGMVENCAGGGVVLVPQNAAMRWPNWIREERCDAAGRYEIAAVRPGDYYLLGIAKGPSTVFWNPEWNESLLPQAAKVTVRASEASSADLRAIAEN